eukprot:TRINITY_DN15977_c0_g1_i1.p1 TRINITY_DN15977_c0_g1~~TRINITY_DN15977_c0_g1_i1.p1  ORF type:complete len:177 (+),score=15.39 TRINITY_DN15977_c0_g1_i1:250-780(+)
MEDFNQSRTSKMANHTLFINRFSISLSDLDSAHHYDYTTDVAEQRGGETFRLTGRWGKIALKVIGRFENDSWLDSNRGWFVVFHGTPTSNLGSIITNNLKIQGGQATPPHGAAHGVGIYCSPNSATAESYCSAGGSGYKIIFFCRVRPNSFHRHGDIWVVPDESNIRILAVLYKAC